MDVKLRPSAAKTLRKLPKTEQRRIVAALELLAETPRPPKARKLSDITYRVRVGDYRITYDIHDSELIILIIKIGHRRDVYRNLQDLLG